MKNFECSKVNIVVLPRKKRIILPPKFYAEYKHLDHTQKSSLVLSTLFNLIDHLERAMLIP